MPRKRRRKMPNPLYRRNQEFTMVCDACTVGIGTSIIKDGARRIVHHHLQEEPNVYRKKNYCDSCFGYILKRLDRR